MVLAADHREDASGFDMYPTIFFYSGTRGYNLPAGDRTPALAALLAAHPEVTWAVQTHAEEDGRWAAWRKRIPFFSRTARPQPLLDEALLARGFVEMSATPGWTIFHRARQ